MEGFISTSTNENVALDFNDGTIVEIIVKLENLGGKVDHGFAEIESQAYFAKEQEILFNAFNLFKVLSVGKVIKIHGSGSVSE